MIDKGNRFYKLIFYQKLLRFACYIICILSTLFFLIDFLSLNKKRNINLQEDQNIEKASKKVMTNPYSKINYANQYFTIKSKKAISSDNFDQIILEDVVIEGDLLNIRSKKLVIRNNGMDLHFTGKPLVIIKNYEQ